MDETFASMAQLELGSSINEEQIKFRYQLERIVMTAVANGDYESIREVVQEREDLPYNPYLQRIPDNVLRDRKNGSIIRNTFLRIAAIEGGLPPVYVHLLSERIALMIEQATSVEYLDNELADQMIKDYCEAVKYFSTKGYSELIKEVISYISNHMFTPLTLEEVANEFHVNGAHLSRKFKQETGFTFTVYVNNKRVEYAKLLFHEGNTSITEVASLAGFNSSSYFSKVFKKEVGISPKKYMKNLP